MCCSKVVKKDAGKAASSMSLNILLLDDEEAVLVALSRLLKARGHQCSTAQTGEILLDILKQGQQTSSRFDLAILDIKIVGGMGGVETMQQIKLIDSRIPILSMSGNPVDTLFEGDEASGFAAHLEKPFSADHLSAEIERVCSDSFQTSNT